MAWGNKEAHVSQQQNVAAGVRFLNESDRKSWNQLQSLSLHATMARRTIGRNSTMTARWVSHRPMRLVSLGLALLVGAASALQMNTSNIVAPHIHSSSKDCSPPTPTMTFSRRSILGSAAAATTAAATASFGLPNPAVAAYIDPNTAPLAVTKRAYLDVQIGDNAPGRIIIGLYGEVLPKTTENFSKLAESNSYADTLFYRVISDRSIQGGAIGDPFKGRSGKSAFEGGEPFVPDSFNIQHTKSGLVSAVRTVDGKADSRFFIQTAADGGWADDRYAAFGIVEEGMDLVGKIEKLDVQPPQNAPKVPVKIVKSGVL